MVIAVIVPAPLVLDTPVTLTDNPVKVVTLPTVAVPTRELVKVTVSSILIVTVPG